VLALGVLSVVSDELGVAHEPLAPLHGCPFTVLYPNSESHPGIENVATGVMGITVDGVGVGTGVDPLQGVPVVVLYPEVDVHPAGNVTVGVGVGVGVGTGVGVTVGAGVGVTTGRGVGAGSGFVKERLRET